MGQRTELSCLLLLAVSAAFFSPASCENGIKRPPKSRLMMEYDWPEPSKNLKRIPHPESCEHFYAVKADGGYSMKKCPTNEIFDYRSLQCKEKPLAKCWKDIVEKGRLKKLKRSFSCPFPWGLYPDVEDCYQFFECLGGIHYIRKCPASTLFDKAERTCAPAEKALCADESDVVEPGYKCPYKWGYYAHSKDCSKYYECLRKVPNIRTCGKNLLFDNFRRNCFPMQEVDCGKRLNPYDKVTRPPKEEIKVDSTSESATSDNTPTKGENAQASTKKILDEEILQSTQAKITVVPLENTVTSTQPVRAVTENLAKTTKHDVVDAIADDKVPIKTISTELTKVAEENSTNFYLNTVENNETDSEETTKRSYTSKPGESDKQAITTSIPASKTSRTSQGTIAIKHDEVSEETAIKYDKTSVEDVHDSSSKTVLTSTEAKVDKKAEDSATSQQN